MTDVKAPNRLVVDETQVTVENLPKNLPPVRVMPMAQPPMPPTNGSHVVQGTRSLMQLFGLHAASAALAVIVDLMVFGGDIVSAGLLIPVGIGAAIVLGVIVYRIQRHSYFDTHDTALTKALIIGLVTAIPVPLTPIIVIPSGLLGLVQMMSRGKNSESS